MLIVTQMLIFWTLEFQQGLEYNLQGHVHYNPCPKNQHLGHNQHLGSSVGAN